MEFDSAVFVATLIVNLSFVTGLGWHALFHDLEKSSLISVTGETIDLLTAYHFCLKLLEKCVCGQINEHLFANNLLGQF